MLVHNVWLTYPGRKHAVTATSNTLLFERDENPAWGIGIWLPMAVDLDEREEFERVRTADRVPLVVDSVERETSYSASGGMCCRAALVDGTYYAAICPVGEAGDTRLVTG